MFVRSKKAWIAFAIVALAGAATSVPAVSASADPGGIERAALPANAVRHVIVIDLENESFSSTFGPGSPAVYLNQTLVPQGELIEHYYATGHVSLDNYIAQISGQAPNPLSSSDCAGVVNGALDGMFVNVTPGTLAPNQAAFPGQVDGTGCVYPGSVSTIANQLDAVKGNPGGDVVPWRVYAEDMGNTPARDGGTPDPLGGTDCAHPSLGGSDPTNSATAEDQYATRHNPAVYFHSIIDNTAECNANVVPLGTVTVGTGGARDTFHGHLAQDLAQESTTPRFAFITPNLCNDGHDGNFPGTCTGTNTEGGKAGGLVGADLWLKHWMPLILGSPAYQSGHTLVVITFDEGNPISDTTSCCNEQPGPAQALPGISPLLQLFGITPAGPGTGGGQVGAVLLNPRYIVPGTVNTTGSYNHYSALRSYEDMLGIWRGGADGFGHLGFAGQPGLVPFGHDVFNNSRSGG